MVKSEVDEWGRSIEPSFLGFIYNSRNIAGFKESPSLESSSSPHTVCKESCWNIILGVVEHFFFSMATNKRDYVDW